MYLEKTASKIMNKAHLVKSSAPLPETIQETNKIILMEKQNKRYRFRSLNVLKVHYKDN